MRNNRVSSNQNVATQSQVGGHTPNEGDGSAVQLPCSAEIA